MRTTNLVKTFGILPNDRCTYIGKTGCGKTTLAEVILSQFTNVIAVDSKHTLNWAGFRVIKNENGLNGIKPGENVIFRVPDHWGNEEFDKFFRWVLKRGNTTVYVDEMYAVASAHTTPQSGLGAIATRGRELGVGLHASTQRPTRVPLFLISESEHQFLFTLRNPKDVKIAQEICEQKIPVNRLKKRGFYHVDYENNKTEGPLEIELIKGDENGL
jgi:hypothetical protein